MYVCMYVCIFRVLLFTAPNCFSLQSFCNLPVFTGMQKPGPQRVNQGLFEALRAPIWEILGCLLPAFGVTHWAFVYRSGYSSTYLSGRFFLYTYAQRSVYMYVKSVYIYIYMYVSLSLSIDSIGICTTKMSLHMMRRSHLQEVSVVLTWVNRT